MYMNGKVDPQSNTEKQNNKFIQTNQGLVKGEKLCLYPDFFGWLEK